MSGALTVPLQAAQYVDPTPIWQRAAQTDQTRAQIGLIGQQQALVQQQAQNAALQNQLQQYRMAPLAQMYSGQGGMPQQGMQPQGAQTGGLMSSPLVQSIGAALLGGVPQQRAPGLIGPQGQAAPSQGSMVAGAPTNGGMVGAAPQMQGGGPMFGVTLPQMVEYGIASDIASGKDPVQAINQGIAARNQTFNNLFAGVTTPSELNRNLSVAVRDGWMSPQDAARFMSTDPTNPNDGWNKRNALLRSIQKPDQTFAQTVEVAGRQQGIDANGNVVYSPAQMAGNAANQGMVAGAKTFSEQNMAPTLTSVDYTDPATGRTTPVQAWRIPNPNGGQPTLLGLNGQVLSGAQQQGGGGGGNINRSTLGRAIGGIEGPGVSYKGANEGVMPDTFKQYALPGENIDNTDDRRRVRDRILDDYWKKYNGDPARIAVAFFSGPGNVAPPGSPTPWIDGDRTDGDKNHPGLSVKQYVEQTLQRAARLTSPQSPSVALAQPALAAQPIASPQGGVQVQPQPIPPGPVFQPQQPAPQPEIAPAGGGGAAPTIAPQAPAVPGGIGVGVTPFNPAQQKQIEFNNKQVEEDRPELQAAQAASTTANTATMRLLDVKRLVPDSTTGSLAEARSAIGNFLALAPGDWSQRFLKNTAGLDAKTVANTQELVKQTFQLAGDAEKSLAQNGQASVRIGAMLTQLYAKAMPNINMQKDAINQMTNWLLVGQQMVRDFGGGASSHILGQQRAFQGDMANHQYEPVANFYQKWNAPDSPNSPVVYEAAAMAMNGADYKTWSKGLHNQQQLAEVGRIVANANPVDGSIKISNGQVLGPAELQRYAAAQQGAR